MAERITPVMRLLLRSVVDAVDAWVDKLRRESKIMGIRAALQHGARVRMAPQISSRWRRRRRNQMVRYVAADRSVDALKETNDASQCDFTRHRPTKWGIALDMFTPIFAVSRI